MISLSKLVREGKIEDTEINQSLPINIDGVREDKLDICKIPLKYLYYNDYNGRVSTGITKYRDNIKPEADIEDTNYNDLMENIIESTNSAALKKTQESIKVHGQQMCGWVLDDGRIIDGNRRFTALRNIHEETGKTEFFEAVILPFSYNNETERVKAKKLELALQMGIEERRDYEPLDFAVDIFVTTGGENPMMTRSDYAFIANKKEKSIENYYQGVIYMRKFLEYIGTAKDNYGLIKDSKCWSLFYEMGKTLNKCFGDDRSSQVKKNETIESYFGLILYQLHVGTNHNNARDSIRKYGDNIVDSSDNEAFNSDVSDVVEDLSDVLQESDVNNYSELTKALTDNSDLVEDFGDKYTSHIRSAIDGNNVDKFIKSVKKVVDNVKDWEDKGGLIGKVRYDELSNEQLKQLQSYMRDLKIMSEELFDKYGNEIK